MDWSITQLVSFVPPVESTTICEEVLRIFEIDNTQSLAVVQGGKPVGFLSSKKVTEALSTRYGYALYQKRSVTELMDTNFLTVQIDKSFSEIVERALVREQDLIYEDIVVVQDDLYLGLISIDRVLREQRARIMQQLEEIKESQLRLEESNLRFRQAMEDLQSANDQLKVAMQDLKDKELQVIQNEKMASIGTLAAGIAHDFNNMLNAIISSTHVLKQKLPDSVPLLKYCEIIDNAANRSVGLTKQLLEFAQKNIVNKEVVSLNRVINEMMTILNRSMSKNITLRLSLDDKIKYIEADENQIQQIIMNLVLNARDALPTGGSIHVSTTMKFLDHETCRFRRLNPGNYIVLTVEDTGSGISKELISKIFEPFFTTKPTGKGTGLGLSVVYGIIRRHSGDIEVESEPGNGTRFIIYFPSISEEDRPETETRSKQERPVSGEGTILLVDDEEMVLSTNSEYLQSLGYKVISAPDGESAISSYRENRNSIDLVVLDMVMPGINGRETFHELKKINPNVLVIFASGYTDLEISAAVMKEGAATFIGKPFDPVEFSRIIKTILQNHRK